MKTALIFASHRLSAFAHPNALRLVNIALILRELGYDARLYGADPDLEAQGELKGFRCEDWKLGRGRAARKNRFRNWKARIDAVLAQYPEPDLIISAVSETQSFRVGSYLANYARRKRIPFAVSLVEWFSLKHFSGPGKHDYLRTSKYKNCVLHEFYMRFVAPRRKNIIAISSYLEKYYRAKGCETIAAAQRLYSQRGRSNQKSQNPRPRRASFLRRRRNGAPKYRALRRRKSRAGRDARSARQAPVRANQTRSRRRRFYRAPARKQTQRQRRILNESRRKHGVRNARYRQYNKRFSAMSDRRGNGLRLPGRIPPKLPRRNSARGGICRTVERRRDAKRVRQKSERILRLPRLRRTHARFSRQNRRSRRVEPMRDFLDRIAVRNDS